MAGGMSGGYGGPNVPPMGSMPPPPPMREKRSGNNGCLIGGLVGCGILLVLLVVGVSVGMNALKNGSGGFGKFMSNIQMSAKYGKNLSPISAALERYKADHESNYPPSLSALVPKYLSDKTMFTPNAEDNVVFEYTPPKPSAKPDAIVISITGGESAISLGTSTSRSTIYMRLLKDGRIVQDQVQRVDMQKFGGK